MSPADSGANIQVCVRVRPLNDREKRAQGHDKPGWNWEGETIAQSTAEGRPRQSGAPSTFTFDHLFTPQYTSSDIYNTAVRGIVMRTMEGVHTSVFAYGQTSTGKTHTMQGTEEQPGLIPHAVEECFAYVESNIEDREYLFQVSYLEIYNEQLNDLLSPATTNIRILSHKVDGTRVVGAKQEVVISPEQVYALISAGEAQRHVGSTSANTNSSRSHTIFRMTIESRPRGSEGGGRVSTLSLVDLAGSESAKLSNTSAGERQLEGSFINKSLTTLSRIIYKLSEESTAAGEGDDGRRKSLGGGSGSSITQHLPYRDSKLTRLLQPSLGGNAQVAIVCNITPAMSAVDETRNTLKFASRAKKIRNNAQVNEVKDQEGLIIKYREEIESLKQQLEVAKKSQRGGAVNRARVNSSSSGRVPDGGVNSGEESDDLMSEDENETQLQSAIVHLERLILKSKTTPQKLENLEMLEHVSGSRFFHTRKPSLSLSHGPSTPQSSQDTMFNLVTPPRKEEMLVTPPRVPSPNAEHSAKNAEHSAKNIPAITDILQLELNKDTSCSEYNHMVEYTNENMRRNADSGTLSINNTSTSDLPANETDEIADLQMALERVYGTLRSFVDRKRKKKGRLSASPPPPEEFEETQEGALILEPERSENFQNERRSQRKLGPCYELIDSMEAGQRALEEENKELRNEVTRLSIILAAREKEIRDLKGIDESEETF